MDSFRIALFFVVLSVSYVSPRVIKLPNGKIQGAVIDNYYSYTNIRYAEPPVRFEPAIPYDTTWTGIQNATGKILSCVQFGTMETLPTGQEDCLFLHVFTPKNATNKKLLPVFVYIHGGAFMFGSSDLYSPRAMMAQGGMVVVFINYRVGPLGFLTSGDKLIHGNFGLKDQLLALRWLKLNIQLFGGDPGKILLTGQSAGGASTHLQILRKEAESLIAAAISFSGTALNPWVMQRNAKEKFKRLAEHLNCPLNGEEMKSCLQEKPIGNIHESVLRMYTFLDNPFNLFGPVVEAEDVPGAFLTADPRSLIERGEISNVPWMATMTTEEGAYNAGSLLLKDKKGLDTIEELNDRWFELAPYLLFFYDEPSMQRKERLSESLREMYMGKQHFSRESYLQLQKMFTDLLFVNGILETIKLHRMFGKSPVYGYVYANPHNYGVGNFLSKDLDFQFGATHGDDEVLFLPFSFSTNYTSGANDLEISKHLIKMFESFVLEKTPRFKETRLPENRNTTQSTQFLQILTKNYCIGPWESNITSNQGCQNNVSFDY